MEQKSRIRNNKELLMFADLFPRFCQAVETPDRGKRAHIRTQKSAEDYKSVAGIAQPTRKRQRTN